ncbi:MAG: hypothetical protein V4527_10165 [Pseudomonadota bacterium]|jgi:hypothetical protein
MSKAKTPPKTPIGKTAAKKPAAKAAPAAPKEAKAAAVKPADPVAPAAAAAKPAAAKAPPHPKPEQPMWARMNQGHSQKMSKGRPFRHQGR